MIAIETKDLFKSFGTKTAVKGLDLCVNEGELFALLGVNGAGKTTTIRMLSCLSKPTKGDAFIFGNSVVEDTSKVKRLINVSPQETAVATNLTVRENLELMAGIYGFDKSQAELKASQIISEFSMEEVENSRAKTLSGGWQRRLSIAMALISEPKVLFLDEPTLGLDVLARRELWKAITDIKGKVTIMLTTHYMEEAESLSDRIAVMVNGEIRALGTVDELKERTGTETLEEAFVAVAEGGMQK